MTILKYYLKFIYIVCLLSVSLKGFSQNDPFNCDHNAYLFQYNDVYSIDLASGNSFLVAENISEGNINAAAYNPADGYMWGSLSSPEKTIVRIGNDFSTTTFYIPELPTTNRYVGGINGQGVYYLKGGGTTYYKIDLNPSSPSYLQHLATESLSQSINVHDWAFNAVDGNLYTVEKNTNILYRINPSNGVVQSLGEVPILTGLSYTYGAVYFDASGRFYVSANQTGTIYVIQNVQELNGTNSMESNLFAFGPSSSSNDGARCPTAPVPQEICDNGIDDDGDGLIDCEDPSCSGYGECDVILPPTSGGNEGGLESTNRLSEQINLRNYQRAKINYKFDREKAARVEKSQNYRMKKNGGIQLKDFIPLEVIKEDEVIESTPSDLVQITNATDIYAVDYMKEGTSIASILALRTENGVYEHTKYICDRLLGAELISVSTIEIAGQKFIKSLIRNTDNTVEFVLSLAAKEIDNNTQFSIESHWNLDKYESNVAFYNFQIWSNSLDDLYLLANEVINLLQIEKPITDYNLSIPPTVFVRKGTYKNGMLDLHIINTNKSDDVQFDAGYRATETSAFNTSHTTLGLHGNYMSMIKVATGNLFDIGFRIGDGIATPDDLFMSDGPWGIDDSQEGTNIKKYEVDPNNFVFEETDFPIERNVILEATTRTYFAVYRALTPRFKPVDLTDYNNFKFKAKGSGKVEITLVKKSITSWEKQFKAVVNLTDSTKDYTLLLEDFKSSIKETLELNDIVTIVFTMWSDNGEQVEKQMHLSDIRFSKEETLFEINNNGEENYADVFIAPNPLKTITNVHFKTLEEESLEFVIYDQLGKQVYTKTLKAKKGDNEFVLARENLPTGLYLCQLIGVKNTFKTIKLLVD